MEIQKFDDIEEINNNETTYDEEYARINHLRLIIASDLQRVPEGHKVHISKNILEQLIFDELEIIDNPKEENINTTKVKLVVSDESILEKVDLSEIDFNNILIDMNNIHLLQNDEVVFYENLKSKSVEYLEANGLIDINKVNNNNESKTLKKVI